MNLEISDKIKKIAISTGFDIVGITDSSVPLEAISHYEEWIKRHYHADLEYMNKNVERRLNPKNIMENVKSIICLGLNYYNGVNTNDKNKGIICRYARGMDYHKVIEEKTRKLIIELQNMYGESVEFKPYVDYGAILERVFAEKAGLGFIGRNKNLITKEFGSWVFLSVILTDIELSYDQPLKAGCGTCRACIEACPTKALIKKEENPWDREVYLDARKCISFQTIESKKDKISHLVSSKMKNRFFGCDICQEVCPWNREPKMTRHKEFLPESGAGDSFDLNASLSDDEDKFREKYINTPILRMKLKGLKKNLEALKKNIRLL